MLIRGSPAHPRCGRPTEGRPLAFPTRAWRPLVPLLLLLWPARDPLPRRAARSSSGSARRRCDWCSLCGCVPPSPGRIDRSVHPRRLAPPVPQGLLESWA
jgi:hypothetical protein